MLLCLDLGNSHLYGGVFNDESQIIAQFRFDTRLIGTEDQIGVFLKDILQNYNVNLKSIERVGISSVVPHVDFIIYEACVKYLHLKPLFLKHDININIKIKTSNPHELGADFIAGAMGANKLYPYTNIIIFDFGTATKCALIDKDANFLGTSITSGVRLMMESLHKNAAKLPLINITKPTSVLATSTIPAIQSGIYYSQLGFVSNIISNVKQQFNMIDNLKIIATGGYSYLFNHKGSIFDDIIPELLLIGIKNMLDLNNYN